MFSSLVNTYKAINCFYTSTATLTYQVDVRISWIEQLVCNLPASQYKVHPMLEVGVHNVFTITSSYTNHLILSVVGTLLKENS